MSKDKREVIYYDDELNNEFSRAEIEAIPIDENYKYIHKNIFWRMGAFISYRIFATPFAFIYTKLAFNIKVKNKELLKGQKEGYFLYGNHTQEFADAFIPSVVSFPKRAYVIVHPNNVSMKGLKTLIPMLGALPLPDTMSASRNFLEAIKKRCDENKAIVIYPEAHIWPWYNKIRNFSSKSFRYPIMSNKPAFCFTNVYKKRKHSKKPEIITYIDGPFYADSTLSKKEQEKDLRDKIYNAMVKRSEESDIEYIKYIPKVNENEILKDTDNIE